MNIHTHLIGAVLAVIGLLLQFADLSGLIHLGRFSLFAFPKASRFSELEYVKGVAMRINEKVIPPDALDHLTLTIFMVSAIVCLGCSATFHTFTCYSEAVRTK